MGKNEGAEPPEIRRVRRIAKKAANKHNTKSAMTEALERSRNLGQNGENRNQGRDNRGG